MDSQVASLSKVKQPLYCDEGKVATQVGGIRMGWGTHRVETGVEGASVGLFNLI